MNYEDRVNHDNYKGDNQNIGTRLMSAKTLVGNEVCNHSGDSLGDIKEIMLDTGTGKVCYAVLSYGGVFGVGSKLFAVPWSALKLNSEEKTFVLNIDKDNLKNAPGFDKDNWPDMADKSWESEIHTYYGTSKP